MRTETKITLGVIGVLLSTIAVLAIVIAVKNRTAKAKTPEHDTPVKADDVFDSSTADKETAVTAAEMDAADRLASRLYRDMDGLNLFGHDESIYNEVILLSDRDLSILNAVFNKKYGHGETLAEWLAGESFAWTDSFGIEAVVKSIIQRLEKL